jgi:hypothetical protein
VDDDDEGVVLILPHSGYGGAKPRQEILFLAVCDLN